MIKELKDKKKKQIKNEVLLDVQADHYFHSILRENAVDFGAKKGPL
jgi:hypothetical protein